MIDVHCHTRFSIDSQTEPCALIEAARAVNLTRIAITDHADFAPGDSSFDPDSYLRELAILRGDHNGIRVAVGVELGIQVGHAASAAAFLGKRPFDMVIASMHRVRAHDIGVPGWGCDITAEEAWTAYFQDALDSARVCDNFDVFGHLDIPRRYGITRGTRAEGDSLVYLDALLAWLISEDKTLELNTSGFRYGLDSFHPQKWIMERYFQLGGRRVTVGSDAHVLGDVGSRIPDALALLREIGFTHVRTFFNRSGEDIPIPGEFSDEQRWVCS
ncbi:MAG: histidinol-phosphatase HisJ family protein [Candidatus Riflebacteria bacterium]|nr:histidinol-phosphatase HisJ family protein [Candidatus Riflebacteria bacterium]